MLWSNVTEDIERTCILFLTGVRTNEMIHFYTLQHFMLVVCFRKCSVTPSLMIPHISA